MARFLSLLFTLLLGFSSAQSAPMVPAAPAIAASGYLLYDMDSGRVLVEKNTDQRLEPASLTKIMTAYVMFHEIKDGSVKLEDKVLVSEKAWKTPGSRMFIEVGKQVTIDDLLKGMIIQSGNDACVAMAEHVAGSEQAFANLMNEHAARLGMSSSHFTNATGLPHQDHYTTPRDIVRVTEALIREFPEFYKLFAVKEFTYNKIKQSNRNNLLWRDTSVDGVKTGHTEAAGYCLVSSAKREGMRLISVVMGTSSTKARIRESQSLLNFGFRFYETHRLYGAGTKLSTVRVWKGNQKHLALGLAGDLYVTIPRRQYKNMQARTETQPKIMAPIIKGQPLGKVIVELAGETVREIPLVALQDMPEGGLWRGAVDSVLLLLE